MQVGTPVILREGNTKAYVGKVHKPPIKGIHIVRTKDNKNIKCRERDLHPDDCEAFLRQQFRLIEQLHHFSHEYKIPGRGPRVEFDAKMSSFVIEKTSGIEEDGYVCQLFDEYLGIFRKDADLWPYVMLHPGDDEDIVRTCEVVLPLTNDKVPLPKGAITASHIQVRFRGQVTTFRTKVTVYTMEMGQMYILLRHPMFHEAVAKNCSEIANVNQCRYQYDALNRYISFTTDGMCRKKILGLNSDPCNFIIWSKLTFTKYRYKTFISDEFHAIHSLALGCVPTHIDSAVEFLHLQLGHAMQMLHYCRRNGLVQEEWAHYEQMCVQVQHTLVNNTRTYKGWDPHAALAYVDNHSIPESWLKGVWACKRRRDAWLANFYILTSIYTVLFVHDLQMSLLMNEQGFVVINNVFLGSFEVEPLQMQAILYQNECSYVHDRIQVFTDTVRETFPEKYLKTDLDFRPSLDEFSHEF